jgi:hypothetical protein
MLQILFMVIQELDIVLCHQFQELINSLLNSFNRQSVGTSGPNKVTSGDHFIPPPCAEQAFSALHP